MDHRNEYEHDQGVVIKKNIGIYQVRSGERVLPCSLSPRLRKELVYPIADPSSLSHIVREVKILDKVDPVAVGDCVRYVDAGDGTGLIVAVLPRRSRFSRRDPYPGRQAFEQVIVANVDTVIPVFAAAAPTPKWNMLDRYLAAAESLCLPVLIVITKLDLVRQADGSLDDDLGRVLAEYRRIGYPVHLTSSVTGEGIDSLREYLKGRLSVLVGKSGVGKTALLNALQPGLGLRVQAVGEGSIGKGKHTTTQVEMIPLETGGELVDTPGTREFGLLGSTGDDPATFFPEMRPFIGQCKFRLDCRHDQEPGCAIRRAVMAGQIDPHRFQSYLRLKEEICTL